MLCRGMRTKLQLRIKTQETKNICVEKRLKQTQTLNEGRKEDITIEQKIIEISEN